MNDRPDLGFVPGGAVRTMQSAETRLQGTINAIHKVLDEYDAACRRACPKDIACDLAIKQIARMLNR